MIDTFHKIIFFILYFCYYLMLIYSLSVDLRTFITMYNKNFNPYGQFPSKNNQLYQQQYEEQQSQPLIEEVDDSYEPTEKQVREYAIETLGMRLPQDQGLLYLARQGLKAPLPDNWVPYQSRDGEVYYKHRITQEKTYDHPTDLQYKKKYDQQKQKMARKNLKSMNMKASNQIIPGPAGILNSNASNLFGSKLANSNMFAANVNSSALNDSAPSVKLDPKIQQEYEEELGMIEQRLKREWKKYEAQQRQRHETRIKKRKQEYEGEIDALFQGKQNEVRYEDKINQQKLKIKRQYEESADSDGRDELKEYERDLQQKNKEFQTVYEEDMQFKVSKYQQQKDGQFQEREKRLQERIKRVNKQTDNKKKQIEQTLKKLRVDFQSGRNRQIQIQTAEALQQQLQSIRASYQQKLKARQSELQRQYNQTKRVLGFDQNSYLSEIAAKKSRIKNISNQKIESFKKKQHQMLNLKYNHQFQEAIKSLRDSLQQLYSQKQSDERKRLQQRVIKQKQKIQKEYKIKIQSNIQNVYEQMKTKLRSYQTQMNKKLSSVQQKFINDIYGKTKGQNSDLVFRIEMKQKQMLIDNKRMMIQSLKRQAELQKVTYDLLKLQGTLNKCKDQHDIDEKLLQLAKSHELEYRSDKYLKYEGIYKELKEKYRNDKGFLASIMSSLQNYKGPGGIGSQAILKQYNQDVRIMRQNDEMLRKVESLLKKAQVNDRIALEELSKIDMIYQEISLKEEMMRIGSMPTNFGIEQISQKVITKRDTYTGVRDIENTLKDHFKFLRTMRGQLNRKLYQIRNGTTY